MRKPYRKHLKSVIALLLLAVVGIYVLNASTAGHRAVGCPAGCSTTSERNPGPMRVVSLNMLHGFPLFEDLRLRVVLITTEIKRLDADVVLLQEVPWTLKTGSVAAKLAADLGYNYIFLRANGSPLILFQEGEAILSRFPLTEVVHVELKPRVDLFQHRVVLGATALTPWGDIRLFSTHLTHSDPEANLGQVADLQAFVEAHTPGMGVVAGDFNAKDGSPEIIALGNTWVDTYRTTHPDDSGLTCCIDDLQAAAGELLEMRIDYIFLVHPTWRLMSAGHAFFNPFEVGEGWQWASDHTGLEVELEP